MAIEKPTVHFTFRRPDAYSSTSWRAAAKAGERAEKERQQQQREAVSLKNHALVVNLSKELTLTAT